mmetsp:Transcript_2894/g.4513  ORF Transcript_2894/g.4513 Transcript_2894/m.4513 type:complete len:161 (+) Transcript_2894:71-553(+)
MCTLQVAQSNRNMFQSWHISRARWFMKASLSTSFSGKLPSQCADRTLRPTALVSQHPQVVKLNVQSLQLIKIDHRRPRRHDCSPAPACQTGGWAPCHRGVSTTELGRGSLRGFVGKRRPWRRGAVPRTSLGKCRDRLHTRSITHHNIPVAILAQVFSCSG